MNGGSSELPLPTGWNEKKCCQSTQDSSNNLEPLQRSRAVQICCAAVQVQNLLCCCTDAEPVVLLTERVTIRMRCTLFLPLPSAANARLWLGLNRVPGPPNQSATGPKTISPATSTDKPAAIPGIPRAGASISATCRNGIGGVFTVIAQDDGGLKQTMYLFKGGRNKHKECSGESIPDSKAESAAILRWAGICRHPPTRLDFPHTEASVLCRCYDRYSAETTLHGKQRQQRL